MTSPQALFSTLRSAGIRVPHVSILRRGSERPNGRSPQANRPPVLKLRELRIFYFANFARAFVLLTAAIAPALAQAPLDQARHRIQASDYRATGRLVQVNGATRTTYRFSTRGHWFPDGLHVQYDFTLPTGGTERVLYHLHPDGRLEVESLHQGAKAPVHVTAEQQAEPLLNSGLAYEDLVEAQFFWPSQAPGAPSTAGERPCIQLKSVPAPQQSRRYSAVISCVDPANGLPLLTTKMLRTGRPVQFTTSGIRDSGGMAIATQIKAQTAGESASTLILIDHGSTKAHLTAADFDLAGAPAAKEPE